MLWRIAARLLTGPLAFLLGGVLDVGGYAASALMGLARRAVHLTTIRRDEGWY